MIFDNLRIAQQCKTSHVYLYGGVGAIANIIVPDAPAGIKAMAATPESVIVTWQRPKNENGRIVKFHVYIRILDHGSGREIRTVKKTVPPSTWNYEVTDLKRREAYEVWVTGETRIGEGSRSSSVSFTSSSMVPAGIISFGKVIATPWKADVLMPCLTVGVPAPIVTWRKKNGRIIDPARDQKANITLQSFLSSLLLQVHFPLMKKTKVSVKLVRDLIPNFQ
ncbi:Down syndrome cell adhesion molecule-like protein Dscam2 [Orchesella cincta]|uniref:Down syndrome cell adhesion molecule-like protein Dscam2 n=1 Tax=Orchesella cincta TaxID=48709 RepID=A0A1D2N9X2_ORCCI|nr:Down syndrome cell adhesion molecule-like protein Dscam2 [Orchesella cincta]